MNAGFVSTRFAGTDGVSLEAAKWAEVLGREGHFSHWYSGCSDRPPDASMCVPEAFFRHPDVEWINRHAFGVTSRSRQLSERIRSLADYLKSTLYRFADEHRIDLLVAENAVTLPMNLPLGVAVTEFLAETGLPAIAHHHDFFWERSRYSVSGVNDILDAAFPPRLPRLGHAVLSTQAREQLSRRKGVGAAVIPNVFDFEQPAPRPDEYSADLRQELGLAEEDLFILQPTRVVPRKGIEHAIRLAGMLDHPRCKLVISHDAGDEGYEYLETLRELAEREGVDLRTVSDRVGEARGRDASGRKIFTLWDIYPHCDLVTYPSLLEGFGNALLEAIYFKKPIMVNRYSIFIEDIEPKGFRFALMDGLVTRLTAGQTERLLGDESFRRETVDHNYEMARRFYSYEVLRQGLTGLLASLSTVGGEF